MVSPGFTRAGIVAEPLTYAIDLASVPEAMVNEVLDVSVTELPPTTVPVAETALSILSPDDRAAVPPIAIELVPA